MPELQIIEDDVTGPEITALLRFHLDEMFRIYPPESVHALPIDRLREADVTFFSAWAGERLAGCGALKQREPEHGEIKSMRVVPDFLGQGVGRAILQRLLDEARRRGYSRVSLETGTDPSMLPARTLYAVHGFTRCAPLPGYPTDDPLSLFMTLDLTAA